MGHLKIENIYSPPTLPIKATHFLVFVGLDRGVACLLRCFEDIVCHLPQYASIADAYSRLLCCTCSPVFESKDLQISFQHCTTPSKAARVAVTVLLLMLVGGSHWNHLHLHHVGESTRTRVADMGPRTMPRPSLPTPRHHPPAHEISSFVVTSRRVSVPSISWCFSTSPYYRCDILYCIVTSARRWL